MSLIINLLCIHYTQLHFCRKFFLYVVFTQEVVKHIHLIKTVIHNKFAYFVIDAFITLSCIFEEGVFFMLCLHKRLSSTYIWLKLWLIMNLLEGFFFMLCLHKRLSSTYFWLKLSHIINLLSCYRRVHYTQSHFCRRVFLNLVYTRDCQTQMPDKKIVIHNEFTTLL